MKPILSCFLFILVSINLQAQSVLHDAIELRKYLQPIDNANTIGKLSSNPDEQAEYLEILVRYVDFQGEPEIDQVILDGFFENPFLSDRQGESIILLPDEYHDVMEMRMVSDGGMVQGAPGQGMFVSNLADALSNFLVKRTKQELTMAFFRDFQDKIENNAYLNALFPETASLLKVIDTEIYQFNTYLGALRENFARDLKVLPGNLKLALETEPWLDNNAEMRLLVSDLLGLSQMLVDGKKPVEFIDYLGNQASIHQENMVNALEDASKTKVQNLASGLMTLELLSNSIRSEVDSLNWIDLDEVKDHLYDPQTMYLFLALVYQKAGHIQFSAERSVQSALRQTANTAGTVEQMRKQVLRFAEYGQNMRQNVLQMSGEAPADSNKYEAYYQFLENFFGMLEAGLDFRRTFLPDKACDEMEDQFISDLRQLSKLNLNVRQKQYSLAVTNLAYLLDRFLGPKKFNPKTKGAFLKYGMFMASVAEADNPNQIEAAIELFAMPPGSSSLKKHAKFSISLNTYTGLNYGKEKLDQQGKSDIAGISAPLGLGLNFGLGRRRGSLSFFTSIIDVGAITAYRFDDANSDPLPALEWSNIVAPGTFLVYGLGWDIPISVGFGAQMGPNLRKVTNAGLEIGDRGWRMLGFIAVDIPITHFYTNK